MGRFMAIILLATLSIACARTVDVRVGPAQPAATAELRVGTDDNDNTEIDLRVRHLAPPERLSPPRNTYIVWVEPEGAAAINQGQLVVGDDLQGRFTSVTSHRTFDLIVTAEMDPQTRFPAGEEVMRSVVNR